MNRPSHFSLFTSLRAIAALTVFAFHAVYQIAVERPENHQWYRLGVNLDIGVPIFFAISGFLLYRPFLDATLDGERASVRAYAWRRLLRIVPAYWVALAVIAVWFELHEVGSLGGWLRFAGFAQVYSASTALKGVGQAWTLDVEMAFYVFLPLFALGPLRARSIRGALIGVCSVIFAGVAWNAFALSRVDAANRDSFAWLLSPPAQLDQLGMGMLLAVLSVWAVRAGGRLPGLLGRIQGLVERRPMLPWTFALVLWLACGYIDTGSRTGGLISDPEYLVKHLLRTGCAVGVLAPAVFGDRSGVGLPRKLLAWRPLVFVGTVSYSLYLWHYVVVVQEGRWWGRAPIGRLEWVAWCAGALAGALAISWVSYRLIEKPFMSLRRLVPAGPRAPQVEAAQARAAP